YGFIAADSGQGELPVGWSLTVQKATNTEFLMNNCALCHTGEINGKIIPGLGARDLRINAMNNSLIDIFADPAFTEDRMVAAAERAAGRHNLRWDWRTRRIVRAAISRGRELLAKSVYLDAGPGRNTPIEFAKVRTGVALKEPYGYVRFPPIWTYKRRASFGWD